MPDQQEYATSATLLERLRRPSDGEAWSRFVHLYTPLLFHWARRLTLREDDAADLVQDLFARLIERLPGFRRDPQGSFRGWLWTLLKNLYLDRVRRQKTVARMLGGGVPAELPAPDDAEALIEQEYNTHLVNRALALIEAECSPADRDAFRQYVVYDRPAGEVAASLGISVNSVYLTKSRILRRLREELQGLLDD